MNNIVKLNQSLPKRNFSKLEIPSVAKGIPNFINVTGNDGVHLHTVRFPHNPKASESPKATIIYFHGYGAYIEKNAPIIARF